jgi:hypothetical protein
VFYYKDLTFYNKSIRTPCIYLIKFKKLIKTLASRALFLFKNVSSEYSIVVMLLVA